jgi:hypothetical protein
MSPTNTALVLATPLSKAIHWIKTRLRRRPPSDLPRLVQVSIQVFLLSPTEAQWLTWSLEPQLVALAPKEPAPL